MKICENLQKPARFVQGLEVICPQLQCLEVQALNRRGMRLKRKKQKQEKATRHKTSIEKPF